MSAVLAAAHPCGICGSSLSARHERIAGYRAPHTYDIFQCDGCGLQVASPLAVDSGIYETIYRNGGNIPGYDRYYKYLKGVARASDPLSYLTSREDVYWSIAHALERLRLPINSAEVLEIGSGFGYLTYALAKRGYRITGIDISNEAVTQARRAFGDLYRHVSLSELRAQGKQYDAIIFAEMIEHTSDPLSLLREILALLKPGGALILTTPNRSYFNDDVVWETELPPIHLWWFTEESIRRMAATVGCSASFVDFSDFNKRYDAGPRSGYVPASLRSPVLSGDDRVVFEESGALALLRRLGVYHAVRRLRDGARARLRPAGGDTSRRATLCAVLSCP